MAVKALTFDTGGTILDWHRGISSAFAAAGPANGDRTGRPTRIRTRPARSSWMISARWRKNFFETGKST